MNFTLSGSVQRIPYLRNPVLWMLTGVFLFVCLYSAATTPDLANWLIENMLTFSFLTVLAAFYKHFRFSDLSYTLLISFLLLHMFGSHYGYPHHPFGDYLQDLFQLRRNPYDRLVHFSFGFAMAYAARDLVRHKFRVQAPFAYLLPIEMTLSLSALFELVEWVVADVFFPDHGTKYLGMQGDMWDAQKDMLLAFTGSAAMMGLLYLSHRFRRPPRCLPE